MYTRSVTTAVDSLCKLKSNIIEMNNHMNIASLYYRSNNNKICNDSIVKICINDEQYNKIKNKRIIIYRNSDYDYAELIGNDKVKYDKHLMNNINNNQNDIIESINNNLLDDITVDLLLEDNEINTAHILIDIKNS